jgi:hypothetical protein
VTEQSLPDLEQQRAQLYQRLAATGDLRPGSINATYRKCGKANCACAQPGHPGHGPRWLWTRSAGGKTRTRQLAPAELEKVRAELEAYKQFAALSEQIVEVNEAICEARLVPPSAEQAPAGSAGGNRGALPGAPGGGRGRGKASGRPGGTFAGRRRRPGGAGAGDPHRDDPARLRASGRPAGC